MASEIANIEMEEQVLGYLISHPDMIAEARGSLSPKSFSSPECQSVYKCMLYCIDQNNALPDIVYLKSIFSSYNRAGDILAVTRMVSNCTVTNLSQCINVLEEFRKKRVLRDLGDKLLAAGSLDEKEGRALLDDAIREFEVNEGSEVLDKVGIMNHACNVISENLDPNKPHKQVMTGLKILDKQGGLPPATEVIIAAHSSSGKTSLGLTIMNNAMINGVNCAMYSMEMGTSSIAARFLNMMGWGVPTTRFKTEALLNPTIQSFNELSTEFCNRAGNIFLDAKSNNNADKICASIRNLHRKYGVQLVMVDYIQIIPVYDESGSSDQEQLAKISRKFQAIARELDICILVLSQFSRPPRNAASHEPSEDLIRGSGQIFEACDIALYIYRPWVWKEQYPAPFQDASTDGTAWLKIGKYRDGMAGETCICGFDASRTLFYDFKDGQYDKDPKKNYPKIVDIPASVNTPTTDRPF